MWEDVSWVRRAIGPQYLMRARDALGRIEQRCGGKVAIMSITSSTNTRTMIAAQIGDFPCGHSIGILDCHDFDSSGIVASLNSFAYDFALRVRFAGLNASWFLLEETPIPRNAASFREEAGRLLWRLKDGRIDQHFNVDLSRSGSLPRGALTRHERLRVRIMLDVLVANAFGLDYDDMEHILRQCDVSTGDKGRRWDAFSDPKGFWRVDKDREPEMRHTVLTLIAFRDFLEKTDAEEGDRDKGMKAFLGQNHGEGWMIPEAVCLTDYGLGSSPRSRLEQPVASRLGGRFYDWQIVQDGAEWWRECQLHSTNIRSNGDVMLDTSVAQSDVDASQSDSRQIELFSVEE